MPMNLYLREAETLRRILDELADKGAVKGDVPPAEKILVEAPRDEKFGDFSSSLALVHANAMGVKPPELAAQVAEKLAEMEHVQSAAVAGPGFINWKLTPTAWQETLRELLAHSITFPNIGGGRRVNVEFVSANPTGPLTMGHARGAVIGDALATLFSRFGWQVVREYYTNDAGGQIEILARTVELRMKEAQGTDIGEIPAGLYPGEYLKPIGERLAAQAESAGAAPSGDEIARFAVAEMMSLIRDDLNAVGIRHDRFSSDFKLREDGAVEEAVKQLEADGHLYRGTLPKPKGEDAADWEPREQLLFRATEFGDTDDRPLQRSNGEWTYFAGDIAYHYDKHKRTEGRLIDVWGADHGGYNQRIASALKAVTRGKGELDIVVCQIVRLFRGEDEIRMSKRAGEFVSLRQVVDEVGADALRFTLLTRKPSAPLDFDLNAAVEKSLENPLFYVQYAHARTHSVLRLAREQFPELRDENFFAQADLSPLVAPAELKTIAALAAAPRVFQAALEALEPHRITLWLRDLAGEFHALWSQGREETQLRFIVGDDLRLTAARLALVLAVQNGLRVGLEVIGVRPLDEL